MELQLQGRQVLVTGASKGIGKAIALAFAAEGARLVLVARDGAALDAVRHEVLAAMPQVEVTCAPADLALGSTAAELAARFPDVDVLVNDAGAIPPGALDAVDDERWRAAWDLKVFGYLAMCRAFYAAMKARCAGVIVNVIGISALTKDPNYTCGVTGNAALTAFTQSLGSASHADGIRVVGISPGPVATERLVLLNRAKAERLLGDAERFAEITRSNPFGRSATPQEVATSVVFLASPASAYASGTVLMVDGGISARQSGAG